MASISNYRTVALHVLMWVAYGLLAFSWFSNFTSFDRAFLFSIRSVFINAIIFYVNIKLLLPYLIDKNRYWLYILSIIVLIIGAYFLSEVVKEMMDVLLGVEERASRRGRGRRGWVNPRFFVQSAALLAVLFISTTYWMTSQSRKRKQKEAQLQNQNLSSELRFLKSQINPHFLFNALNNIYSLSYTGSKKTPDMIMKLSEMMRYVLYESNEQKVSLEKEVDYISHYIAFQKLKMEQEADIVFETSVDNHAVRLEPMLFIPFIENSFKHSNIESAPDSWVKIQLRTEADQLTFEISNSVPSKVLQKDATKGIGIENVKKRLSLLYPGRHQLEIREHDNIFNVTLRILT